MKKSIALVFELTVIGSQGGELGGGGGGGGVYLESYTREDDSTVESHLIITVAVSLIQSSSI